ncbi:MAG: hypothetical protein P3W87_005170, partial [Gammaproteobacteria bacterium]|nr:hypothetical protein [Gammaproteobacteria bacterium]
MEPLTESKAIPLQRLAAHLVDVSGYGFSSPPMERYSNLMVFSPGVLLPLVERYTAVMLFRLFGNQARTIMRGEEEG